MAAERTNRGRLVRNVVAATVIVGGSIATGVYVISHGHSNQESGTTVSTPKPETPTATATAIETVAVTPKPTETIKTPQEKLSAAIAAQNAFLSGGEIKFPLPEDFIAAGGRIEKSRVYPGGVVNLYFIVPVESAGKEFTFPVFLGGEVIETKRMNADINDIEVKSGNLGLKLFFPFEGSEFLVKNGQRVDLNTPGLRVKYDPDGQKSFRGDAPAGTVLALGIQDLTAGEGNGFGRVTEDNILKDAQGGRMVIPSQISSK